MSKNVRFAFLASLASLAPLALLAASVTGCTQPVDSNATAQDDSPIVGGKKVTSSDALAKITVAIVDADVGEYCTGVVLDSRHVVTASHCFDDTSRVPSVRVGVGDTGKLLAVTRVAVHAKSSKAKRDAYDRAIANAVDANTSRPCPRRTSSCSHRAERGGRAKVTAAGPTSSCRRPERSPCSAW